MKRLDNKEFIKRSIKFHGDKYDYSLVNYINSYTKIKIICPVHGIFEQPPSVIPDLAVICVHKNQILINLQK